MAVTHPIRRLSGLALAGGALLLAAAPAGAVPTISGSDNDVWNASEAGANYTITASSPRLRVYWQIPGVAFDDERSPARLDLGGLRDGAYRLEAREGFAFGVAAAVRTFRIDTTPPRITIRRPAAGGDDDDRDDDDRDVEVIAQGATVLADYTCEGAVSCVGSVASGAPIDTSRPGPGSFSVVAVDDAGNQVADLVEYEVAPGTAAPAAPAAPAVVVAAPSVTRPIRPRTLNARRLLPRAGARVLTRRPLLRWRAHSSAQLYNVQLFRLRGAKATKVLSAFPRTNRFRVPAKRIAPGDRYVWRVWPYLATGYPDRPLGLSYFDARRRAAAG